MYKTGNSDAFCFLAIPSFVLSFSFPIYNSVAVWKVLMLLGRIIE